MFKALPAIDQKNIIKPPAFAPIGGKGYFYGYMFRMRIFTNAGKWHILFKQYFQT
jgi:hypothetical protein